MLKHTVEEVTLANGSKGLFIDVPDASVMVYELGFRAGDLFCIDDGEEKWETAHIMEHLSLGANKKFKRSRDFTAELEKNGAYANASTGSIDMTYSSECADFEWERVLGLLMTAITEPLFLQEEFDAECGNVYQELLGRGNNHAGRLAFEMNKQYGFKTKTFQERAELMKHVTREDVVKHHKKTHFSENMRFVIAGNLKDRKGKIKELLERMPSGGFGATRLEPIKEVPKPFSEPVFIPNETVPNAFFYADTYCTRELDDPELYALGTLNVILTEAFDSRIFGEAREKGLIYYFSSSFYRDKTYSSFWFGSQVAEEQLKPVFDIVVREIGKVLKGEVDQKHIDAAKLYQLGGFQRGAQTVGGIAGGYQGRYFYNGEISKYYEEFADMVNKVEKEHIITAAQELFREKIWGLGFLGTISEQARLDAHRQLSDLWT